MTPRQLLAFLDQTRLKKFTPAPFEAYYARLAAVSGIDEAQLRRMGQGQRFPNSGLLACCPECLATDDVPYIRASWSWPTTFVCPVHRALISTRCHICGEERALKPFEAGPAFTPETFRRCLSPRCHSRIEESASGHLSEDHPALWLQNELHHPDPSGLAFIRDGRGIQRSLLSWLYASRSDLGTYSWALPFEPDPGLVLHWRGEVFEKTKSALTLSQLLGHPGVEDDLILTRLVTDIRSNVTSLLVRAGQADRAEYFKRYRHWIAKPGALCALFLAWSEVPVLTEDVIAHADLEAPLSLYLGDKASSGQEVLQLCEDGRRHLLHRLRSALRGASS